MTELEIIRWVQAAAGPGPDALFIALTMLSEKLALVGVLTAVCWTADREAGERLGWMMALTLAVNGGIKGFVNAPRPIGQPGVRTIYADTATGSSFPSGHSQNAAAFYPALGRMARARGTRLLLYLLPLAVGLSRLYLGVHYPRDVLAGLALGWICSAAAGRLFARARRRWALYLGTAAAFSPLLALGGSRDFVAALGCLAGFALAAAFGERFVRFSTDVPRGVKLCRWSCGIALLGALAAALKAVLPPGGAFAFLRYAALIFVALGGYPWVFSAFEKRAAARREER